MSSGLLLLVFLSVSNFPLSSAAFPRTKPAAMNNTTKDLHKPPPPPFPSETIMDDVAPRPKVATKTPVLEGDIAVGPLSRNADPCTARGCKWPKSGSYVYVPYHIEPDYTQKQRNIILRGLRSFHKSTCIRFIPRTSRHRDYIQIFSRPNSGCWSYVGRQYGGQYIALEKRGCLYHSTVQHAILHALGFNHEHTRSDRNRYVRILFQNIKCGAKHNFERVQTNNLGTPYDFNSVMQYSKYAFSKNDKPTIVAKRDPNFDFGHARQMSGNDILRVNRLYKC